MKLRHSYILLGACLLLFSALWAEAPDMKMKKKQSDAQLLLDGINLSYNNRHQEAQEKFALYKQAHPDDLLVAVRILYDRFSSAGKNDKGKFSAATEYQELLLIVNKAIATYETKQCSNTNIEEIADHTIDCPYIGAALYSFRMGLVGANDSWFKVIGDRDAFVTQAGKSKVSQTLFLLGLYEYQVSVRIPFGAGWIARWKYHVPTDEGHALTLILKSLEGNESPFRDDIVFFMLDVSCYRKDAKAVRVFTKERSLVDDFRSLLGHHPGNKKIRECPLLRGHIP